VEDAVELLRALGLRRVTGALDHRQPAIRDQPMRTQGVRDRKQGIVRPPDQLHRHLDP
jgi:hypothetical protein